MTRIHRKRFRSLFPRSVSKGLRAAALLIALTGLAGLAACGSSDSSSESGGGAAAGETTLERIQREGVVRVGYANEAPYAYKDSANGNLTGEAPEIARVVMKSLGVNEMEGVLTEFGSLIPGLKAGRFDIIAAGMYILPERCRQIAFSNPTYAIGEAFAVQTGNPRNLHSFDDVRNDPEAKLGVVAGAVQRDYARKANIPDSQVIVFPDAPSALAGVEAGRVHAYAGTSLTVQDLLDKTSTGDLERAEPFTGPSQNGDEIRGYGAFGIRPEDDALREAINEQLAAFIGTPEHAQLVRPFGFTEFDLPGDRTAEELCAVEP
jgi:polar amino acid transport system substrate-binding protein